MIAPNKCNHQKNQSGFTLLEVLISMVILAIGLFGLATLQTVSLRTNTSAYQRSIASMLAYDMMDRMRTNWSAAANGDYDDQLAPVSATPYGPPSTPSTMCIVTTGTPPTCTPAQMAAYDLWEWATKEYKLKQLPGAKVDIVTTGPTDNKLNVTIKIKWQDINFNNSSQWKQSAEEEFIYSSIIRTRS